MNSAMTMQLMVSGFQIAKMIYEPILRDPIKNAVEGNDYKIDDKIFAVIDTVMTGAVNVPDEAGAHVLMAIYCPYLREPLKAITQKTGTKADDIAFQIIDMVFGQNCTN